MLYRSLPPRGLFQRKLQIKLFGALLLVAAACGASPRVAAQTLTRELSVTGPAPEIVVRNDNGRVTVVAEGEERKSVSLVAESPGASVGAADVQTTGGGVHIEIAARQRAVRDRIDLTLRVPPRARLRVETNGGAVDVSGPVSEALVVTDTGTIRADVPTDALAYSFRWTASRPRFFSEIALGKIKERAGGRFELHGRLGDKKAPKSQHVRLDLQTARGLVLFGVDPAMVPSDLRERPLTEAARGIIRSGNVDLIDAIRKVAPRYVGEYAETLPPRIHAPTLANFNPPASPATAATISSAPHATRLNASVTDTNGRAIHGLKAEDFIVIENGQPRPVTNVETARAPFNLVLLLDVSGSVEERLDFIRKAALDFLKTVSPQDRIAIISFRDDIQLVSDFTTDRNLLAERIKLIDAGGATSLYDALAYTLVNTLKPLRGERTAIVILSDGDDNRSFVPFGAILESVVESGALIYPLYLPSGLIPTNAAPDPATTRDPTRARFLTLTSRADEEGRKLAAISGGVYYSITHLGALQRAYDDVVAQLRTAYTITYDSAANDATAARRVRVRLVNHPDASIRLSPVVVKPDN
ncbi:MAG TPA: VWA domain-containing protein [Pyrinomonadaceae bacterium]|jgi:VWFA-related protein